MKPVIRFIKLKQGCTNINHYERPKSVMKATMSLLKFSLSTKLMKMKFSFVSSIFPKPFASSPAINFSPLEALLLLFIIPLLALTNFRSVCTSIQKITSAISVRPWRSWAAFKHCQTRWWNNWCGRISNDFNAQNEEWTIFNIKALLSSSLGRKLVHIICITIYLTH